MRPPTDYHTESLLRNGRPVFIRAIRPDDKALLADLFSHLSERSVYFRFMSAKRSLSSAELKNLSEVDFRTHVALAATVSGEGGEQIIGVGRYTLPPRPGARSAEVAFTVIDEFQGLGVGTLLLEHLKDLAVERGIEEFTAEVLSENERMLDVFASAGLGVNRTLRDGTFEVRLDLHEASSYRVLKGRRERLSAAKSIGSILSPKSVVVVGASRDVDSIGGLVLKNLLKEKFRGKIYAVNPRATEVQGLKSYRSVEELPEVPELAVITTPAQAVEGVLKECGAFGVRAVAVISAGFGEVHQDRRATELALRHMVRGLGMRMVGPNCMGVLNTDPEVSLNATFSPIWPPAGNVSIMSQSGALGLAVLDYVSAHNLGIASFVSVGNKADVSGNDLLCYWAEDPQTEVIAIYLESFGNPRRFGRIVPEIAREKPIVAVKSGRSAEGVRAAASHSAALANLDVAVDALFEQAGVIRATTLQELFDIIGLLATQPVPKGPRVGIITNAGGPAILLADALAARGLSLPELNSDVLEKLREQLPQEAAVGNPVDMIASASAGEYRAAVNLIGNDENVDSVVLIYVPPLVTDPSEIMKAIAEAVEQVPEDKPVLVVYLSTDKAPKALHTGPRGVLPCYSFPENAALALSAVWGYQKWLSQPRGVTAALTPPEREEVRAIIDEALKRTDEPQWLKPDEVDGILRALQISTADSGCTSIEQAGEFADDLGYPLVAKVISSDIIHKSDSGCVKLGLTNRAQVQAAAREIEENANRMQAHIEGVMLQRHVKSDLEAIVGVTLDPTFGPLLVLGLGGVLVELLRDVVFRLPPVTDLNAKDMVDRLRSRPLLEGYRGAPVADRCALEHIIMRVSALVGIAPEITEMDLNPIKVLPEGEGAVVVDARIRIAR